MKKRNETTPKGETESHFSGKTIIVQKVIFLFSVGFCLTPLASAPVSLLLGLLIAQFIGNPYLHLNHRATRLLLQVSVVGLGFGMNVGAAMKAGSDALVLTIVSIFGTLLIGYLLGRALRVNGKSSYLIAAGTAICGGSAIAAISPVIKAEENQMSVALGTVFILNAIALILFPYIGKELQLSSAQFGLWCAIAIHDTSSVVGAASKYGAQALEVATTIKLARALWIIPLAFFSSFLFQSKSAKAKIPYFIAFFILAMILNTYSPFVQLLSPQIVNLSKAGLNVTLFLIGSGLSKNIWYAVGIRPLLQGVLTWVIISTGTLWFILFQG